MRFMLKEDIMKKAEMGCDDIKEVRRKLRRLGGAVDRGRCEFRRI
jgi:hypothetical protein